MATSTFAERIRKPLRALGFGVAPATTTVDASVPLVTAGSGAASASDPNGSLRLRTDGVPEYRIGSAWSTIPIANQAHTQSGAATFTSTVAVSGAFTSTSTMTTTAGVASGTARKIGGQSSVNSASATTVTNIAAETDCSLTYSIPANTIVAGTSVRIRAAIRNPSTNGTDTFQAKLYIGTTAIHTTAAVDLANDDIILIEGRLVGRAAAGASASCAYMGQSLNKTTGAASCAVANFATNGALVVKVAILHGAQSASNQSILEILEVDVVG